MPPRDLVFAFVSDEEAGGTYGAQWLVDNRPDLFEGVTEAIGEVGGFSLDRAAPRRRRAQALPDRNRREGPGLDAADRRAAAPGHGSMVHDDNAVTEVAEAVARLGRHQFPLILSEPVEQFLTAISEETGYEFDLNSPDLEGTIAKLGGIARIIGATLRDTANPTMLKAGYKANVIPATAEAVRGLPGAAGPAGGLRARGRRAHRPERGARAGSATCRPTRRRSTAIWWITMNAALLTRWTPSARTVPYMMSGGTDAKSFQRLGIRCFGLRTAAAAAPTWTSRRCSTASTNGYPWTH